LGRVFFYIKEYCFYVEESNLGKGETERFHMLRKGIGKPEGFPRRSEATSEYSDWYLFEYSVFKQSIFLFKRI
jgi:hypothetical protein